MEAKEGIKASSPGYMKRIKTERSNCRGGGGAEAGAGEGVGAGVGTGAGARWGEVWVEAGAGEFTPLWVLTLSFIWPLSSLSKYSVLNPPGYFPQFYLASLWFGQNYQC